MPSFPTNETGTGRILGRAGEWLNDSFVGRGELFVNVRDPQYGVTADGVTDDRVALQNAINSAAPGGTVLFPPGEYWLGSWGTFPAGGDSQFTRFSIRVPAGISIVGQPGAVIAESADYATRRVVFFIEGSDVTIEGLSFENRYDMAGGGRPTSVMIGAGDAYDQTTGDVRNVVVRRCHFRRAWHPIKFAFHQPGGTAVAQNIAIQDCTATHEQTPDGGGSLSSGGYNFRSTYPPRISDIRVTGCTDENPSASAGIGLYCVQNGTVSGNLLNGSGSTAAGIQLENGSDNITITGNTLSDHINGIWVDDSTNVTVSGNTVRNTAPDTSFKGIRVTWQGYDGNPDAVATGFNISGNVLNNCGIRFEIFSTLQGNARLGTAVVAGNTITSQGVVPYGISVSQPEMVVIANNLVVGAATTSIRVVPVTNTYLTASGNITHRGVVATGSTGFQITNGLAFRPVVSDNHFTNGLSSTTAVGGAITSDTRWVYGTGTPEGALSAGAGTLFVRADGAAGSTLYVKETASGSTGWAAK